jgi:tetratricopeptide (TPR) repeat protein
MMRAPVYFLGLLLFCAPCIAQELKKGPTEADKARAQGINEGAIKRFKQGDLEDALGQFRKACEIDPTNSIIKKNIARCYAHIATTAFKKRKFKDAARDFGLAADFDPADSSYIVSRGQSFLEGQLNEKAVTALERATRVFPKQAQAYNFLGLAYYNLGRNKDALKAWKTALKLKPGDVVAGAYIKKVSKEDAVEGDLSEDYGSIHFRIKFDGRSDPTLGRLVGKILEEAYEDVGRLLGFHPEGETAVVIYPGKTFQKITGAHSWVKALYDGKIRVPGKELKKASVAEIRRIFRHEYTHALIHRIAGRKCPVWLHEGLAQIAEGHSLANSRKTLKKSGRPTLASLKGSFVKVKDSRKVGGLYSTSHLFTVWLAQRAGGTWKFEDVLKSLGAGTSLDKTFNNEFGDDLQTLFNHWKRP